MLLFFPLPTFLESEKSWTVRQGCKYKSPFLQEAHCSLCFPRWTATAGDFWASTCHTPFLTGSPAHVPHICQSVTQDNSGFLPLTTIDTTTSKASRMSRRHSKTNHNKTKITLFLGLPKAIKNSPGQRFPNHAPQNPYSSVEFFRGHKTKPKPSQPQPCFLWFVNWI